MSRTAHPRLVLIVIGTIVLAVDQATKLLAVQLVDDRSMSWGPVSLAVSRNTGGPFGFASSMSTVWALLAVVGGVVAVWGATLVERVDRATVAAAVVAGGVFGNLVDRIAHGGGGGAAGVVDWISFAPYPFALNLADIALRGGALAWSVALVRGRAAEDPDGWERP